MEADIITLINSTIVPIGLIAVMFSMGLGLSPADFREVLRNPRGVVAGLGGQLFAMPLLALGIAWLFALPVPMATGLFLLSICPGGVTSNAITFAAKANVALAVTLTAFSSLVTVFSIPLLAQWALQNFYGAGEAPEMSVVQTMTSLAVMTVGPIGFGMIIRHFARTFADRAVRVLRPAAIVVLIAVILASVLASADLLVDNIVHAGPAVFALNVLGMAIGVGIGVAAGLRRADQLTVGIEVGVQNATMATFLTLSILDDLTLAITPTLYGCIMVINAGLLVAWFRRRQRREDAVSPAG